VVHWSNSTVVVVVVVVAATIIVLLYLCSIVIRFVQDVAFHDDDVDNDGRFVPFFVL
jgi:uncharacterized membrane protein YdbT with pleckstrin-like domain